MLAIEVQHMAFGYGGQPLFVDATFILTSGWYGLIGANGSGKSTLLRLLAGELTAESGQIRREPSTAAAVLCPQRVDELDDGLSRFAESNEALAHRLRGRLRLQSADLDRWKSLSPGERKRWQIGAALALEPDILLLDEPTNHIDADAQQVLVGALRDHRGVCVVVSHDRNFLNGLTATTLHVQGGTIQVWPGGYDAARTQWEREQNELRTRRDLLRQAEQSARQQLAACQEVHGRAGQRSSGARGRNDHDRRSMEGKNRGGRSEAKLGRLVATQRTVVERAAERAKSIVVVEELGRDVFVDYVRSPRPRLFALDRERLDAGEKPIFRNVHVAVQREDRIWIRGTNGSGKTTLLHALLAASDLPPNRVLFVPQDLDRPRELALLVAVRGLTRKDKGRVLALAAALGADPDQILASDHPSPGNARKLMIADGLARCVWVVVLDEPTNHLDLPSIERLESALAGYPGAALIVSHDVAFAKRCTSTIWDVEGGTVRIS